MTITRSILRLLLIGFCILAANTSKAQSIAKPFPNSYQYLSTNPTTTHILIAIEAPQAKQALLSLGYVLCKRLSYELYIAQLPTIVAYAPLTESRHRPITGFINYGPVNDYWKIPKYLLALPPTQNHTFLLSSSQPHALYELLAKAENIKAWPPMANSKSLKVTCTLAQVEKILKLALVNGISQEDLNPQTESRVLDLNMTPNKINAVRNHYPEAQGQGIVVSIKEPLYHLDDIDLLAKHIPSGLESERPDNHSTDMATLIAGRGNSSYSGWGVAPEAMLSSSHFAEILPDAPTDYQRLGVSIQNHSYGTSLEAFYGVLAEAYDQSTIDNPQLLHVFSAGNSGSAVPENGTYAGIEGYANITGNFKMSKNTLSVGSADTLGRTISFASKGPAYDGRVKPELVAYSSAGSSNSAALVSGVSALLQQHYQEQFGTTAASALIKALLINSATDAGPQGLDFETGYGNLHALRALRELQAGHWLKGNLNASTQQNFDLEIPANAKNLKITLVWTDPPAAVNSAIALVNDLDLSVSTPNAVTLNPWVLDASANALANPAVRGKDRLNNVEQVSLGEVAAGTYTIKVEGFDLSSSQDFYLAYQYDMPDRFEWTYPLVSDHVPFDGETTGYIQWEQTLSATQGTLQYRLIGEENWKTLASNLSLSQGRFRWQAPNIVAKAQLRMLIGETQFLSDTFRISKPTRMTVGFSCGDSLLFRWPPFANATDYQLYALQGSQMAPIASTADTSIIIHPASLGSNYFALAPRAADGKEWARTATVDYRFQGGVCYLQAFFASNNGDLSVDLTLRLSDIYQVNRIVFERRDPAGNFVPIGETASINGLEVEFLDSSPLNGENEYRAVVELSNGERIASESQFVLMLVERKYQLFPNPLPMGKSLAVFSQTTEEQADYIRFYDGMGRLVWESEIFSDNDFLDIPFPIPGLYYYQLIRNNEIVLRGKLLVNWY